jgi:hypothetical protein
MNARLIDMSKLPGLSCAAFDCRPPSVDPSTSKGGRNGVAWRRQMNAPGVDCFWIDAQTGSALQGAVGHPGGTHETRAYVDV